MSEDLQAFRIDAITGGMGGPIGGPTAAADEAQGDVGYPTLQEICAKRKSVEAFAAKMSATREALEGAGADGEKALAAYGHLETVLQQLVALTVEEVKKRRKAAGK
jgi:hypothetical protein